MDSWFVHTIRVKDTLAGEKIRERKIKAVHLQHAQYIDRSKEIAIFILQPIDGQNDFSADYQIVDFSWPSVLYCFDKPLSELGLDPDDPITYLYKEACYESPFEDE